MNVIKVIYTSTPVRLFGKKPEIKLTIGGYSCASLTVEEAFAFADKVIRCAERADADAWDHEHATRNSRPATGAGEER